MSDTNAKSGRLHLPRPRTTGVIHLLEQDDGTVKVMAMFDPMLDADPAHVPSEVEIVAAKMMRAVGRELT